MVEELSDGVNKIQDSLILLVMDWLFENVVKKMGIRTFVLFWHENVPTLPTGYSLFQIKNSQVVQIGGCGGLG